MNWLTCTHCGRSTYSRNPEVVEELSRGGIMLVCPCGRLDSWRWYSERPVAVDLPGLTSEISPLSSRLFWRDFQTRTEAGALASSGPTSSNDPTS